MNSTEPRDLGAASATATLLRTERLVLIREVPLRGPAQWRQHHG